MTTFHFQLITPEKVVIDEEVERVQLPTEQGEIGILPGHTPLITAVKPGELTVYTRGRPRYLATGVGYAEITNDNLTLLTDLAAHAEEIDEAAEKEARKRARAALAEKRSAEEIAIISAQLEKSLAKLHVKRRARR